MQVDILILGGCFIDGGEGGGFGGYERLMHDCWEGRGVAGTVQAFWPLSMVGKGRAKPGFGPVEMRFTH